jgi:hypothetical protein
MALLVAEALLSVATPQTYIGLISSGIKAWTAIKDS